MADTPASNSGASPAPTATDSSTQQPQSQEQSNSAPATSSAEAQAAAVIANPNASNAQKAAAIKKLSNLRIKVDGQEYDEKLPFEIEDTKANREWMTKNLQMSKAAQKRMGEKAQLENEVR